MAAKDYKICCGFLNAYIAKESKRNKNEMTTDRRVIPGSERLTLIAWELEQWVTKNKDSVGFRFKNNDGQTIEVHYVKEDISKQ